MSEAIETQSKAAPPRDSAADARAFAAVEKWMAVIRELRHQPAKN